MLHTSHFIGGHWRKLLCHRKAVLLKRDSYTDIYRVIKKSLCTWWLQYRKLQVIFKVSHAILQTFIDTQNTLVSLTNARIMASPSLKLTMQLFPACALKNVSLLLIKELSRYSDWLWAGRSVDRIPVGARFFIHVQTGPRAHPASCTMGTGSFPGVKRPGRGADHPPPPSVEVENE
jgi:hypothetical protein